MNSGYGAAPSEFPSNPERRGASSVIGAARPSPVSLSSRRSRMRVLIVMASVAGALAALGPQNDAESRPSAAPDAAPLKRALTALLDAKGYRLSGDVAHQKAEDSSGGMAQVMVLGGGSGGGTPFTGGVEVERTAKGELFLLSRNRVPGFAALDNGERAVVSATFE